MKILFIVDYYYPAIGGAEILYQHLAEGLVKRGHEVIVLTQMSSNVLAQEMVNGVSVFRVKTWQRALFPYQAFRLAKQLCQDADIIQAGPYAAGVLAARLRKLCSAKVLLTVYEYLGTRWLSLRASGVMAYLYEKYLFSHVFDYYVAISDSTRRQLLVNKIAPVKVGKVYCGIDTELFKPQPINTALRKQLKIATETKVFLYAGRSGITKGIWVLLQTIKKLRDLKSAMLSSEMQFVFILGKHPITEYERIRAFIQTHALESLIIVLDSVPRNQLPQYIAIANTVIIPSLTEGFGFFAAEVSAMQIPLIVSKVDALPEVVSGKAIFIEPGNSDDMLRAVIEGAHDRFLKIPPKHFSWENTCVSYEQLYKNLRA